MVKFLANMAGNFTGVKRLLDFGENTMKRKTIPKPRNPFVQHLVKRKSTVHGKPYKVSRRDAKVQLKRDCSDKLNVFQNSLNGSVAEMV